MSENNNNNGLPGAADKPAKSENTINLSFALTKDDLFWYNLHFIRLFVIGFFIFLLLFIAGFILVIKTPKGDIQTTFIWMEIGFGIVLSICMGAISAIVLQVYFLKSNIIARAMSTRNYIIDTAGIAVFDKRGKIVRTWKDVKKIIKTRKGFYFRTSDKLAIIIPRRVFKDPDMLEEFENIITNHAC